MPPLRERKKDVAPLVQCLVYRHAHTSQKLIKGVTKAFMDRLISYDWPGNIRELENTLRSAIALCKNGISHDARAQGFGLALHGKASGRRIDAIASVLIPFVKKSLDSKEKNIYDKVHTEVDRHVLTYLLSHTRENQSEAARLLGINRLTLRKKLGLS